MTENQISYKIIGACYEVHGKLGPGMLESTYQKCLTYELLKHDLEVDVEVLMPIKYKDLIVENAYKADIIVNKKIVLELKSVEDFTDAHFAQLLTYLKLGNFKLGLLLNFNVKNMRHGIKRIVNNI
ncbi:MAG: GxxExxY protein [Balneolia bacterium]|nr:GxxExxY protein [Balneolia bacterium]